MVAYNKDQNKTADSQASNAPTQGTDNLVGEDLNFGQTANTLNVFEMFGGGSLSQYENEGFNKHASQICEEIKKFIEDNPNDAFKFWKMEVITHPEIPNDEMVALYIPHEDKVYLHPILFAEKGGRTVYSQNQINGLGGNLEGQKTSTASILFVEGFKQIVLNHLVSKGTKVAATDNLYFCGCSLVHAGHEVKPNQMLANASNEVFAIVESVTGGYNPNTVTAANLQGTEIRVETASNVDKTNMYGHPVFAPVIVSAVANKKSTLQGNNATYTQPIGEVSGYMDFLPFSQSVRQQEQLRRQQANNPQRVPSHKPFFVIADETWAGYEKKGTTAANLLSLFSLIPTVADGINWIPRVVNAQQAGFSAHYDFAAVGYDEANFGKAMDEVHDSKVFNLAQMQKYGMEYFSNVDVRLDIMMSGPNSLAHKLLLDPTNLNRLLGQVTGQQTNFASVGEYYGRFPAGTYNQSGKKRDIRELLNYYSWATWCKGDRTQLQRWMTWFGTYDANQDERYFAERLKMAGEISNGTFELQDVAMRISISTDVINAVRNAFEAQQVKFKSNAQADVTGSVEFGYGGDFSGGMQVQQGQAPGVGGASIGAQILF